MLNRIGTFIRSHQLLDNSQRYLVAVSGGADSVALLRILLQLGYQIEVCHCNFMLRDAESERDESFVRELCHQLGVSFHLAHFDTRNYADLHKVSIEMAARQLRYHYFEQLCRNLGCTAVCVGHHSDDNVETLLLNLLRSTGIHGLRGIRPSRPIQENSDILVVRPLLCVSRMEIESWLQSINQPFITDSTNLVDDVMRNKIRLNLLPFLREIQPSVSDNLQSTALLMNEASRIYDAYVSSTIHQILKNNSIEIDKLRATASPLCILHEWLRRYGFSSSTVHQICDHLDASTGRLWSSETHDICIDRGNLILVERQQGLSPFRVPEIGLYTIENTLSLRVNRSSEVVINHSPQVACLDAEKVSFPLTLRQIHQGDRFIPFGMKGSRLLSDFLTDLKLPLPEKHRQLVVTDAQGNILWVVGRRTAQPYAVTSSTQMMLTLECIFLPSHHI